MEYTLFIQWFAFYFSTFKISRKAKQNKTDRNLKILECRHYLQLRPCVLVVLRDSVLSADYFCISFPTFNYISVIPAPFVILY